ncbi:MAG: tetratricopeptide repeat protein [Candidatus Gastranaerophilaceae bacterium]
MYGKEKLTDTFNYIKLADIEYKAGNFKGAIEYYKLYIEKNPKDADIYNIIGYLYKKIDSYKTLKEQINYFETAVKLKPDFEPAIRNLAFANSRACNYKKAEKYFKKLLKLNPTADDYTAYACLKIRLGDFEEGWKYYEYRFSKCFGKTFYPKIAKPRWGGEKISDKTLLVNCEQGFGDSIQFFRYIMQARPLAKKIIFRVQEELADLFKTNSEGIEIVGDSIPLNNLDFDCHIPIMSLPLILGAKIDTIPMAEGYLKADEKSAEKYKKKYFNNKLLKIGISWHGAASGKQIRDIPVKYFLPIFNLKNVKFYSFQKGVNMELIKNLAPEADIVDLGRIFNNFSDTAAAMENIDLFITCDNCLLNLAGAMGKKTFVLLNKDSEWRWFLDNKTTPWYKSVKIFKKQNKNQSWNLQIKNILMSLRGN